MNVGYFSHGRFSHGHFGQDISATEISAIQNAKSGCFGKNHKFMYFCVYMGGLMLMCACVRDVCTCVYMHACRVHACAMPYFDLAVYIFIVVS